MKQCLIESCQNPVFSHGYCHRHKAFHYKNCSWASKDAWKDKEFRSKIDFDVKQWGYASEKDMFMGIWKDREHKSFLSGIRLDGFFGTDMFYSMFAHLLNKAPHAFPLYKLNPNNIILLTPNEHTILDMGTAESLISYLEGIGKIHRLNVLNDKKLALWNEYKSIDKSVKPVRLIIRDK